MLPLDHSRDDEFDGEDGFSAVAEDPRVFATAVQHAVSSVVPGLPGTESGIHDRELDDRHRADGVMRGD